MKLYRVSLGLVSIIFFCVPMFILILQHFLQSSNDFRTISGFIWCTVQKFVCTRYLSAKRCTCGILSVTFMHMHKYVLIPSIYACAHRNKRIAHAHLVCFKSSIPVPTLMHNKVKQSQRGEAK